ncbi:MAG: Gfo/Idh/MocA family oxidoreductase [Candidatus Latescibacteria bacterium]|nr:Gfo/Idh/MocA family oxidoreductase [Candidatus Latescibacterota bacterium]
MARSSGPIGVAIVGTRFGNLHAEAVSELPERARLVAICSRREEQARYSAQQFGAELATTSFEQVLRHPGVEAVHLCVPHDLHAPMAIAAADAGKHILTEKPIAMTVEDADRMIEAADRVGVVLMVSHNQRFLQHHQRAKDLVASGTIGEVFLCRGVFQGYSPIKGWRHKVAQVGGGVLIDSGIHRIDLLRWIVGEVASVQGESGRFIHQEMEGEDTAVILLRFVTGAIGQVICSWGVKTPIRDESLVLCGTKGTIWAENSTLSLRMAVEEAPGQMGPIQDESLLAVSYPDSVKLAIAHFLECIEEHKQPVVTAVDAREAVRIAQAAYRAIQTGERVSLKGER